MTDQPDLAIVIKDPPAFALGPGLILAVIVRQLPLTLCLCLRGLPTVMLELRLRTSGMPPDAPGGRRS